MVSPAERLAWLTLIRTEGIGPQTFWALLERYGSPSEALRALPSLIARAGSSRWRLPAAGLVEEELQTCEKLGIALLLEPDPDFPAALRTIDPIPPALAVRGNGAIFSRPAIAIVGARNASGNGIRFARKLAQDFAEAGLAVISGLARGIDTAAHDGALAAGTVAVLAGGVDVIYPPENAKLYGDIQASGAIVSEMPLGFAPQARHFPRRNRLISGLALGVLVVEASLNSGSLITARMAAEQGRDVFAVPGSPLDARARGSNDLIRKGATLVESADEVLNLLEPQMARRIGPLSSSVAQTRTPAPVLPLPNRAPSENMPAAMEAALARLSPVPIDVEELRNQLRISPALMASVLIELEIGDLVERHPGQKVSRRI